MAATAGREERQATEFRDQNIPDGSHLPGHPPGLAGRRPGPLFGHAWLWDHLVPLRGDVHGAALEAWTLLGAPAAQTQRLRLGVMVTSNRLRNPALLAKMAATVDVISGGRLDFGIGAGASQLPGAPEALTGIVRREFEAYGAPIVPPGAAIGALAEACTLIRRMWTEDDLFDFSGRHYQLLELIGAGVTHLVLAPVPPWPDRPAQWLADEIATPVAAQLTSG